MSETTFGMTGLKSNTHLPAEDDRDVTSGLSSAIDKTFNCASTPENPGHDTNEKTHRRPTDFSHYSEAKNRWTAKAPPLSYSDGDANSSNGMQEKHIKGPNGPGDHKRPDGNGRAEENCDGIGHGQAVVYVQVKFTSEDGQTETWKDGVQFMIQDFPPLGMHCLVRLMVDSYPTFYPQTHVRSRSADDEA
jgi:hypothetical protein